MKKPNCKSPFEKYIFEKKFYKIFFFKNIEKYLKNKNI